jgi:hypothetical protein
VNVTPTQIKSGDLVLEAALYTPDTPSNRAVVVCHPHPLRGGDMHSNVVIAAARSLQAAGFNALSFNFRGVGASQGTHDDGNGEQDDVRAALQHAADLDGVERVGLAGYSFGAGASLAVAAAHDEPLAVALISLPTTNPDAAHRLEACKGPVLLMVGDADHVSSSEALLHAAQSRPRDATELVIVPGVDHFWRGAEPTLEQHIGAFFTRNLG